MLIRVPTDQLAIGMYVEAVEGSWLDHPFWRSSFRINSDRQLAKLRNSGIPTVVINTARGPGLPLGPCEHRMEEPAKSGTSRSAPRTSARRRAHLGDHSVSNRPCTAEEEIERATAIVQRSKSAVKRLFADIRLGKAVNGDELAPLVDEISQSVARNPYALIGIARLKSKDEYTYLHSVAVCALMINLARHLAMEETLIRDIGLAGLLHDVGKMAVPVELLHKPGALTQSEFSVLKSHPERGHDVLLASGNVPAIARDVCLHHHERIDGSGYPHGLSSNAISLYARMGAVCDVYDAITSDRAYKRAWHPADALDRMAQWHGHFDPRIFAAFVRSVGIYSVGTLVRLRSDRLALVVLENADDLTRPLLRTFYSVSEHRLVPSRTERLDGVNDRIIGPEDPAAWSLGDWGVLKATLLAEPVQAEAA